MKICGYLSTTADKATIEKHIRAMVRTMEHDASTEDEVAYFDNGGIAIVKNSLQDTSNLMWDKEHVSCLALCGHVVGSSGEGSSPGNQHDTLNGAATLLLDNFRNRKEELFDKLNGVFAFAHYDSASGSLTVVNDPYGFMPLYYYYGQGVFVFASEVKAILQVVEQQELDWESCADFLYIGHMMGQKTLFKNVHALDSAQVLI